MANTPDSSTILEGVRAMGFVTTYGQHLGAARYILMEDYVAVVISMRDAQRAMKHMEFQHNSMLNDKERELAFEAWKNAIAK